VLAGSSAFPGPFSRSRDCGCDDKQITLIHTLTLPAEMESQYPPQNYGAPPAFPETPSGPRISSERGSFDADMTNGDIDRTRRGTSVLSGMSIEDMEAAETLNSLSGRECLKSPFVLLLTGLQSSARPGKPMRPRHIYRPRRRTARISQNLCCPYSPRNTHSLPH
jgi:hypothetical protein